MRGSRRVGLGEFVTGVKRNVLERDELIAAVWVTPSGPPQTFMKVGPRNAMVIAVVSLALSAGEELRASFGSAGPRPVLVTAPRAESDTFAERVAAAASPIDDVRGTAAYRRHALRVLTGARAREDDVVRIELRVNGAPVRGRLLGGRVAALRAAGEARVSGLEERLRAGRVRLLLGPARRGLVCACLVLAAQADGHDVTTVEGLADGEALHPVQRAFVEAGAVQCGFCTPGLVVAASDLLARSPSPSDDEIREALSGNLCRCTGYEKIFDAVRLAARDVSG